MQAAAPAYEMARLMNLVGVGVDVLRVFAVVLMVTAALSMFVALMSALQERRYDLALLRTLGARPATLFALLAAEGVTLVIAGVILGWVLGHAAAEALGSWIARSNPWSITGFAWVPAEGWVARGPRRRRGDLPPARDPGLPPRSGDPAETLSREARKQKRWKMLRTFATLLAALALAFGAGVPANGASAQGACRCRRRHRGTPPGATPWQLLQQAKTVQKADKKFGPVFTREIRQLDKQQVKLYGFMMPLDQSRLQKRFLLASFPPHCAFCLPGGPESMVEVIADKPVEFTYEPIVVAGRLAVLEDDVVYYRLTNANAVAP